MKYSCIDVSVPSEYTELIRRLSISEISEGEKQYKKFIVEKVMDNGKQGCVQIAIEDIINQIQEIRTRNNKNWMDILRLAFKHAPDEAKKIIANITECDAEINRLSKKLSEE